MSDGQPNVGTNLTTLTHGQCLGQQLNEIDTDRFAFVTSTADGEQDGRDIQAGETFVWCSHYIFLVTLVLLAMWNTSSDTVISYTVIVLTCSTRQTRSS